MSQNIENLTEKNGIFKRYVINFLLNFIVFIPALHSAFAAIWLSDSLLAIFISYVIICSAIMLFINIKFCLKNNIRIFVFCWLSMIISSILAYFIQYNIMYYIGNITDKDLLITSLSCNIIWLITTAASIIVQIVLLVNKNKQS